ncbi:MAG: hypothetical protein V3U84_02470 [Thiotrichaceae bacterium]
MKIRTLPLLFSLAALTANHSAWALTAANTTISNTATISYDVGGTTQSDIGSSEGGNTSGAGTATTFVVDQVIDLNVSAGSVADVTPAIAASTKTITYDLTNEGNASEIFDITFEQDNGNTGTEFDTSSCTVTAATGSASFTDATITLAKETTANVTVTCTIPASSAVANDDTSDLEFIATAQTAEDNASSDNAATVQVVYGDASAGTTSDTAAKNGIHSAVNTYSINTAVLSVAKTSTIVCDPYNDTTNPKRIPGAVVRYDITVTNGAGAATAANVVIADPFPSNMTYVTTAPAGCTGTVAAAAVATTGTVTGDGIATADNSNVNSTAMSMAASSTSTMTFYGTVN